MSTIIPTGTFLRNALKLDAALSTVMLAGMTVGAATLAPATGLPQGLLVAVGVGLIPWVAFLLWMATRPAVPAAAVWGVIVLNLAWVVACVAVAFGLGFEPTTMGVGFAAVTALGTLLLAELQFVGLRRSTPAWA
jgi:hypothetical protein